MFERLKKAMGAVSPAGQPDDSIAQWASERLLSHMALMGGGFALGGRLHDRPFRAESIASSRWYIQGLELLGKADLDLTPEVNIVLVNRDLKRRFEAKANELYAEATEGLKTTTKAVPEEVRWLSQYRDAGWDGPDDAFWARYAVLTDAPDSARQWLDEQSVEQLMDGPPEWQADTPMVLMLTRGKSYLRLQVGDEKGGAVALHALDILEHLSGRALHVLGR
jgi:hypothetical protein